VFGELAEENKLWVEEANQEDEKVKGERGLIDEDEEDELGKEGSNLSITLLTPTNPHHHRQTLLHHLRKRLQKVVERGGFGLKSC
jgi:hypothetical protein